MKVRKSKIIIIIIFLLGLTILLFPIVSRMISTMFQTKVINNYNYTVSEMEKDKMSLELEKAEKYNDKMKSVTDIIKDPFGDDNLEVPDDYNDILNINGIIGYIDIPKIDINIPIYHGATDDILAKGIGHLETTAFPIGGVGNHSVISGHRGLPTGKMFTDLDKVEIGDNFYIHFLNETIEYEVDQIKVIEPSDTSDLIPIETKDYVTLLTCTPVGINSHRLIVRGERVEYIKEEPKSIKFYEHREFYILIVIIGIILLIGIINTHKSRKGKITHVRQKN